MALSTIPALVFLEPPPPNVMVNSDLTSKPCRQRKPRVCAVSYLNTAPLVWGALSGPQCGTLDLSFAVPSICADRVEAGDADIGLVPAIEMQRHGWAYVPDICIACRGPVRSIMLVSRLPFERISRLAVDSGSRTSVQLARIILAREYNTRPELLVMAPDLPNMLEVADAALLIGDSALAWEPFDSDLPCLDLGEEWVRMTGLPMVFAVWAGPAPGVTEELGQLLRASRDYGLAKLDAIIEEESERRGFPEHLVHQYLTRNVCFHMGALEEAGLRTYLQYAAELDTRNARAVALPSVAERLEHDRAGSR